MARGNSRADSEYVGMSKRVREAVGDGIKAIKGALKGSDAYQLQSAKSDAKRRLDEAKKQDALDKQYPDRAKTYGGMSYKELTDLVRGETPLADNFDDVRRLAEASRLSDVQRGKDDKGTQERHKAYIDALEATKGQGKWLAESVGSTQPYGTFGPEGTVKFDVSEGFEKFLEKTVSRPSGTTKEQDDKLEADSARQRMGLETPDFGIKKSVELSPGVTAEFRWFPMTSYRYPERTEAALVEGSIKIVKTK